MCGCDCGESDVGSCICWLVLLDCMCVGFFFWFFGLLLCGRIVVVV